MLSAIRVQWLPVVHEMHCFYSFSAVLEGILDVNNNNNNNNNLLISIAHYHDVMI